MSNRKRRPQARFHISPLNKQERPFGEAHILKLIRPATSRCLIYKNNTSHVRIRGVAVQIEREEVHALWRPKIQYCINNDLQNCF